MSRIPSLSPAEDDEEQVDVSAPEPAAAPVDAPGVDDTPELAAPSESPTRRPLPASLNPAQDDGAGEAFVKEQGFDPSQFTDPAARAPYQGVIKAIETDKARAVKVQRFNEGEDARLVAVQQKEEAKNANASREAYYRTHGIKSYIDAHGNQVPQLDEDGKPVYHARKWPIEYDAQGRAIQQTRDEAGNVIRTDADAGAPIGTHKDTPNRIYRQNKLRAWDDLGTIDENLASQDPAIAGAAAQAKKGRDALLATQANTGFKLAADAVDAEHRQAMLEWQRDVAPVHAELEKGIATKQADPQYTQTTWFGSQTDAGKQLREDVKKMTDQQAALPPPPTNKDALDTVRAKKKMIQADRGAFSSLVEANGGDVNEAARQFRQQMSDAGADPDKHPALAHLERVKKEMGMPTFADEADAPRQAVENGLRQLPELAPHFQALDAAQAAGDPQAAEVAQQNIEAQKDKAIADGAGVGEKLWNAVKSGVQSIGASMGHGIKNVLDYLPGQQYTGLTPDQLDARETEIRSKIAELGKAGQSQELQDAWKDFSAVQSARRMSGTMLDADVWKHALTPEGLRDIYGTRRELEGSAFTKAGNIAGGIAGFVGEGIATGGTVPLALMVMSAGSESRDAAEEQAKANGETDPAAIRKLGDAAQHKGELFAAATIPIFMLGGKAATSATKALMPEAGALARGAAGTVASGLANMAASAGARAVQGENIMPTGEQVATDWGWALLHGKHEYKAVKEAHAILDGTHEQTKHLNAMAVDDTLPPEQRAAADSALATLQDHAVGILASGKEQEAAKQKLQDERVTKAHAAIDNLDPTATPALNGLAPQAVEDTKNVARGLVKIASGEPMEALSAAEQAAINSPAPDGLPRVDKVKGKLVITQGAIDRLRALVPEAATAIRSSEPEMRAALTAKTVKPDASEKTAPPKPPKPEGLKPHEEKEFTRLTEMETREHINRLSGQEGMDVGLTDEQRTRLRELRQRKIDATGEPQMHAEAKMHAAQADVTHALATKMRAGLEKAHGRPLNEKEQGYVAEAASIWAPAWGKHRRIFDEIETTLKTAKSGAGGGVGITKHGGKLVFNIADSLLHGVNYQELKKNPKLAMARMREEAIHALVRSELPDEKIIGIWGQVPAEIKAQVREAYGQGEDPLNYGHEYLRMVIEGKLGELPTEAESPSLFAELREVLAKLAKHFKNLASDLRKGGASKEAIALVENTRDKVADAYKKLVGAEGEGAGYKGEHEDQQPGGHHAESAKQGGQGATDAGTAGAGAGHGGEGGRGSGGDQLADDNAKVGQPGPGGVRATTGGEGGTGGVEGDAGANLIGLEGAEGREVAPELRGAAHALDAADKRGPVEVPLEDITLSQEVKNFKRGADPVTGIVPSKAIQGDDYTNVARPPVLIWKRKSGAMEIITGRHRLEWKRRLAAEGKSEPTILAHVVHEADGFTADAARIYDAESNIQDAQGDARDYAHYFRNVGKMSRAEAARRGLLRGFGKEAWTIANQGTEKLYNAFLNGLGLKKAEVIAANAPGNEAIQEVGMRYADKMDLDELAGVMGQAMERYGKGTGEQTPDFFGNDDSAMREMIANAKRASAIRGQISHDITGIRDRRKSPEIARRHGVDPNDPEAITAKVDELKALHERWGPDRWMKDPELFAQASERTPLISSRAPSDIARYRQLQEEARAGTLNRWEHEELERLEKRHGQKFMDFHEEARGDEFRLEAEHARKFEPITGREYQPMLFSRSARPKKQTSSKFDTEEYRYLGTAPKAWQESDHPEAGIVNPINPAGSVEQKVAALHALSVQNIPLVEKILGELKSQLGLEGKWSEKLPERIAAKASRPAIRSEKPWHDAEHVRDSLRFKVALSDFDKAPAIQDILQRNGIEIVKLDYKKMTNPKNWGWRFVGWDMRMPNGQLVEFYAPLPELDNKAVKGPNHLLFEKWRNVSDDEIAANPAKERERAEDIRTSEQRYGDAYRRAITRMGYADEADASASWAKLAARLESSTGENRAGNSAALKAPGETSRQIPSKARIIEGAPDRLTKITPSSSSKTETGAFTAKSLPAPGEIVTGKEAAESLRAGGVANIKQSELADTLKGLADSPEPVDIADRLAVDGKHVFHSGEDIAREDMPQVPTAHKEEFLNELRDRGVKVEEGHTIPSKVHPRQGEIDGATVGKMLNEGLNAGKTVMVSQDNVIVDGHHRWVGWLAKGGAMPVVRVNLPIREVIAAAKDFMDRTGIAPEKMGGDIQARAPKYDPNQAGFGFDEPPEEKIPVPVRTPKGKKDTNEPIKPAAKPRPNKPAPRHDYGDLFLDAVQTDPLQPGAVEGVGGGKDEAGPGTLPGPGGPGSVGAGDSERGGGEQGTGVLGGTGQGGAADVQGGVSGAVGAGGSGKSAVVPRPPENSPDHNAVIDGTRNYAPKQGQERFTKNVDAIQLMRRLESENRNATPEEKEQLLAYTGWGWMKEAFNKVRATKWEKGQADIAQDYKWAKDYYDRSKDSYYNRHVEDPGTFEEFRDRALSDPHGRIEPKLASWAKNYLPYYEKLRGELSDEEFDSAAKSVRNAHFTAVPIIDAMWKLVRRLGFKGGNVTEPGAGAGHFIGAEPKDLADRSKWNAVELDNVTARILGHLYPEVTVNGEAPNAGRKVEGLGFQEARIPNGSQDLVISNVPFAKEGPAQSGKEFGKQFNLHNYFFARAFAKAKPGGLVAFITSNSTMDNNLDQRQALAAMGDLVGAIRLPNNAFKENAGTEVTTDIMVFRKPDGTPFKGEPWTFSRELSRVPMTVERPENMGVLQWLRQQPPEWVPSNPEVAAPFQEWVNARRPESGKRVQELIRAINDAEQAQSMEFIAPVSANEYFQNHPEHALGQHSLEGSMYGPDQYAHIPRAGVDTVAALHQAIDTFPENVAGSSGERDTGPERETAGKHDKMGSYVRRGDKIYQVDADGLSEPEWANQPKKVEQFHSWADVRDAYSALIDAELNRASDQDIADARRALNERYDEHIAEHDNLAKVKRNPLNFLGDDPDFVPIQALENIHQDVKEDGTVEYKYEKADVFHRRQVDQAPEPTTASTTEDAVLLSMSKYGELVPSHVADLLGIPEAEAEERLIDAKLGYSNPMTGKLDVADNYLSGNVGNKLEIAMEAAKTDPRYRNNVEALQKVQPPWQSIAGTHPNMRANWVPSEVIEAFATNKLGLEGVGVEKVANGTVFTGRNGGHTATEFEGGGMSAADILHDIIKGDKTVVTKRVRDIDNKVKTVVDSDATAAANVAREAIETAFDEYIKTSSDKIMVGDREIVVPQAAEESFNSNVGGWVPPTFSGDWITLPGQSGEIYLDRGFRKSVLARLLTLGYGMIAHGVGSGKTLTQVALAMEMRRLGKAKKPVIVVEKPTIGQFAASFRRAYPQAKILVAGERNFGPQDRARFLGQMQSGDWDAVIMTRPQSTKIPHSPEALNDFIAKKLAELDAAMAAAPEGSDAQGHIQAQRDKLIEMIRKMAEKLEQNQDLTGVTWEKLGVDALIVDEAHNFKNTYVYTTKENVKNLPKGDFAQQAISMELKTAAVRNRNNGKGIYFATGTPVSNAMHEAWVMLNYIAPHVLEQNGVGTFDQFADTYGVTVTSPEATWKGEVKDTTRFAKFVHGQSLINMVRSVFDVAMGNEKLGLDVPAVKGGAPKLHVLDQTPPMKKVNDWIVNKVAAEWTRVFGEKDDDGAVITPAMTGLRDYIEANKWVTAVPIMTMQGGIAAAVDPRMMHDHAEDHPDSKVNKMVRMIAERYNQPDAAAKKTAQVIFSDLRNPYNADYLEEFTGENPFEELGHNPRQFDLYEDIAKKLVELGIPRKEIGWLESGMKDEAKEAFFGKVNNGEIRVLIGGEGISTGVNIQERLGAAYHLMPPRNFKPAQQEQRNGRIIRQGNLFAEWGHNAYVGEVEKRSSEAFSGDPDFFEQWFYKNMPTVEITGKSPSKRRKAAEEWLEKNDKGGRIRKAAETAAEKYAIEIHELGMEKSLDSAVYSMMGAKQGFIAQMLSGNAGAEFEDPADAIQLSMAQMAAETIGDPALIRKIEIDRQLKKIRSDRQGFIAKRGELMGTIRESEAMIPTWKRTLAEKEAFAEKAGKMFDREDKDGKYLAPLYEFPDGTTFDAAAPEKKAKVKGEGKEEGGVFAALNRFFITTLAGKKIGKNSATAQLKVNGVPVDVEVEEELTGREHESGIYGGFKIAGEGVTTRFRGAQSFLSKLRSEVRSLPEQIDGSKMHIGMLESRAERAREALDKYPKSFAREEEFQQLENEMREVRARIAGNRAAVVAEARAAHDRGATEGAEGEAPEVIGARSAREDKNQLAFDFRDGANAAERIKKNIGLVDVLARRFSNIPGTDPADIRSKARIALVKAAQKFDPSKGVDFVPYAQRVITNDLRDLFTKELKYRSHESLTLNEPNPRAEDPNEDQIANVPDTSIDVARSATNRDAAEVLHRAIDTLPDRLKMVVNATLAGETMDAIGSRLGLNYAEPRKAASNLARMAYTRLRQKLGEQGVSRMDDIMLNSRSARDPVNRARMHAPPETEIREFRNAAVSGPAELILSRSAYHGTPHKVDKFRTERIGTGEGAQVYGWGLYFAENKAVAEEYRKTLSESKRYEDIGVMPSIRAQTYLNNAIENNHTAKWLRDDFEYIKGDLRPAEAEAIQKFIAHVEKHGFPAKDAGNTYSVELDVEPEDLLDWDKPLSQQSEKVREGFYRAYMGRQNRTERPQFAWDITGEEAYTMLGGGDVASEEASKRLAQEGIHGVRYLDQGSRYVVDSETAQKSVDSWKAMAAKSPHVAHIQDSLARAERELEKAKGRTHNYVVFDDSKIKITGENGKPVEMGAVPTTVSSRSAPDDPNAKGFDPFEAIRALQEAAAGEKPGERTIGRPDLALGASDPQMMGLDEWNKANARPETREQWSKDADALLRDKDALHKKIVARGLSTGGTLNPAETIAAKRLVAERMKEAFASGDPNARNDVAHLLYAYRHTGTEAARQMGARFDENMTPEDRHREFLGRAIFTPPPDVQAKLDEAKTPAERKAILAEDQARVTRIEKELAKMGVSLDDIMGGQVTLRLKGAEFVNSATKDFAAKEKEAIRMIQANRSWKDIAKHTGLSEAQIKATEQKLFNEFVKKHLGKFKAGAKAENIDMDTISSQSAKGKVSDEEAMAEAARAWHAMGFGRGDAQGKKPFDLKDPVKVVKVARTIQAVDGNKFSMAYEAWINGILSGPQTHITNITGNAVNSAFDVTLQRGMEALLNATIYHDPKAAQLGEFKEMMKALGPGFARGLRLGSQAWDAEHDFFRHDVLGEPIEVQQLSDKGGNTKGAIPGKLGRVVRVPGRALAWADGVFKGLIGQVQAGAEAYRIAKEEGLTGKARQDRITELVENKDQAHPEAWQRAVLKAEDLTFQQPLKTREHGGNMVEDIFAKLQNARADNPLLGLIAPFVRTPYNIFRQGLRKSPLGAASLVTRFAKAGFYKIKDGKPVGESYVPADQVKHITEQMIAWTMMAALWGAVQGDSDDDEKPFLLTGSMPGSETRRGERDLQQRAYGGDYVARIGGRNGVHFNYGRYEPFATVLGTLVDTVRQMKKGTPAADKMDGLFGYFLAQAQSKTSVQGIADFISALQDPEAKATATGKKFLSTLVPNLVRQPLRNVDDYVRDSRGAGLPYQMLPAPGRAEIRADVYGKDIEKGYGPLSRLLFTPAIKPYPELERADAMLLAWNRANPGEKWAPEPLSRKVKDGDKTRDMTPEEYRKVSEVAGAKVRTALQGRLTAAQIANPKPEDVKMVRSAFEKARDEARETIRTKKKAAYNLNPLIFK